MEIHHERRLKLPPWFYWMLAAVGAYIVYRASSVLLPFIISFVLAYILDPFVDHYEKKGVKRTGAILRVFAWLLLVIMLFFILIIPPVIRQIRQVEDGISRYLEAVHKEGLLEYDREHAEDGMLPPSPAQSPDVPSGSITPPTPKNTHGIASPAPPSSPSSVPTGALSETPSATSPPSSAPSPGGGNESLEQPQKEERSYIDDICIYWIGLTNRYPILEQQLGDEHELEKLLLERQNEIATFSVKILGGISSWAISSLPNLILVILVPLLTFYFLSVIDPLKDRILFLITDEEKKNEVLTISNEINVMLGRYLKGQLLISFLVGASVTLGAAIVALIFHTKYSLLLGCLTGITCIVPYFGALVSMLSGIFIGLFTASTNPFVAALAMVVMLLLVNQLFDNVITPRIVGEQVGLHPIWSLFALLAGSKLLGVAGMLVAVPIAATIKICLIRLFPRLIEPIPPEECHSSGSIAKDMNVSVETGGESRVETGGESGAETGGEGGAETGGEKGY